MCPLASAAAIEAIETNVEAGRVVLKIIVSLGVLCKSKGV